MKSLLVDALRQLEEDKAPEPDADTTAANGPADDSTHGANDDPAESIELELAPEGDDTLAEADPAADDARFEMAGLGRAPSDFAAAELADEKTDPLMSTQSLDVAAETPVRTAELQQPSRRLADAPAAVPVTADTPALQRLAIYTPVLCLMLGTAAAAGYFAYTYVGALNLNTDLGALPEQVSDRFELNGMTAAAGAFPLVPVRSQTDPQPAPRPANVSAESPRAVPVPEESTTPARAGSILTEAPSVSPEDRAYPILEQAYIAWQSGDTGAAERLYREALAIAPGHPNALSGLGAVLIGMGRRPEALPIYSELLALEPDNPAAAAALLESDGESSAGVDELRALLVRHPESAPLHFALGSALAGRSQWADARVAFESAWQRSPDRADFAFNLAVSLERVGRYVDAEAMYQQALALANERNAVDRTVVMARLSELSALTSGARR